MEVLRPGDKIGRAAFPIFLYWILSMAFPMLLTAVSGVGFLEPGRKMWFLTAENFLMLPVFWLLYRRDRNAYKRGDEGKGNDLGGRSLRGWKDLVLAAVGAVCISRGVNYFLALTFLPQVFPGYREVSEGISQCGFLSRMAAVVVSAPLLEEVLMRGLVYGRLKEALGEPRKAIVISGLMFGMFHGNVVQGIYAFAVGLFFAQVYEAGKTLFLPVLAHMAVNAVSLLEAQTGWLEGLGRLPVAYNLVTAAFLAAGMLCWRYFARK